MFSFLYLLLFPDFVTRSHEILSDATKVRLTQVLTPDVKLYNHFSAKLLKRLDDMPPEFKDKLVKFREAKSKV